MICLSAIDCLPTEGNLTYYHQHHLNKEVTLPDRVLDKIAGGDKVLDVGCGNGALRQLLPRNYLVGVDNHPESIKLTRQAGYSQAKLVDVDKDKLPFKDDSFDVIICREVLEHLYYPLFASREMARVIKPNGFLFASVPTIKNKKYYFDYSHVRPFTERSLELLLRDAGFNNIEQLYSLRGIPLLGLVKRHIKPSFLQSLVGHLPILREATRIEVIASLK